MKGKKLDIALDCQEQMDTAVSKQDLSAKNGENNQLIFRPHLEQ